MRNGATENVESDQGARVRGRIGATAEADIESSGRDDASVQRGAAKDLQRARPMIQPIMRGGAVRGHRSSKANASCRDEEDCGGGAGRDKAIDPRFR